MTAVRTSLGTACVDGITFSSVALCVSLTLSFFLSLSSRAPQQKEQPVLCNLPEEPEECLTAPKYKRDLVHKLKVLRQELSQQQPQAGHCRIELCRDEIFEVSPNTPDISLKHLHLCSYRKRIHVV